MKAPLFPILALVAMALAASSTASAAVATSDDPLGDFLTGVERYVKIRQSVADQSLIEKPAKFQWVRADDGNQDSSSIDVGVTFKVPDTAHWRLLPFVEYHRQTLTSKRQNNFQAGLGVDNVLGDVSKGLATLNQFAVSYKDDRYATGEAVLAKATTIPVNPGLEIGWGSEVPVGSTLLGWVPTLGLQYESAENVRKSRRSGHTSRVHANLDVAFYPNGKALKRRCEIVLRHAVWRNFSASPAFAALYGRSQTLFTASLSYYLDPKKRIGIGVDYVSGENPEQGLQKQKATTLALKLKV